MNSLEPKYPSDERYLQIGRLAVIGAGRMGHGIAQVFATAGFPVCCFDADPSARGSVHERIRKNLLNMVEVDLVERNEIDRIMERVAISSSLEAAIGDADRFLHNSGRNRLKTRFLACLPLFFIAPVLTFSV